MSKIKIKKINSFIFELIQVFYMDIVYLNLIASLELQ